MTKEEALKEITEEFNEFLEGTGLNDKDYLESEMIKNEDLRRVVEANRMAIKALEQEPCEDAISRQSAHKWIPVSERLPKEDECIGDVCKYYLIQDEYKDMHVAHYSKVGWIPMDSLKAIGDDVIAWMPLPEPYKAESEDKK